jgi:tRNA-specific 2-thiouridylase
MKEVWTTENQKNHRPVGLDGDRADRGGGEHEVDEMSEGLALVAMSGGVDYSVAAALLLEQGWEVIGATLRLHPCEEPEPERFCCGVDAELAARSVCDRLGIEHQVISAGAPFEDAVLRPAWEAYAAGATPSPCPLCNRELKLGVLLGSADALGAQVVATGHYARRGGSDQHPTLLRGCDVNKDQSYFLFALEREQLARARFPLGGLTKAEVREKARALELVNAQRPGSQDACLQSPDGAPFAELLRRRFGAPARTGEIVDGEGRVLGRHDGLHRYTVGQRRGLGVALGRPAFVRRLDPDAARVELTTRPDELLAAGLVASGAHWLVEPPAPGHALRCEVQVRYRAAPVGCELVVRADGRVEIRFDRAQRAVTPGQAAVMYQGEQVLGGAWIEAPLVS